MSEPDRTTKVEDQAAKSFMILRHAEKIPGRDDHGLTSKGIEQAVQAAHALAPWRPQHVLSSPYPRSVQTANIIAGEVGLIRSSKACLSERRVAAPPSAGTAGFKAEWAKVDASRDYSAHGGESSRASGTRFAQCLRDISNEASGSRIAIVSHGGVLRDFLLNIADGDQSCRDLLPEPFPAEAVPHASITCVDLVGTEFRLRVFAHGGEDLMSKVGVR